jgi:tetratricopeptide (TPR) repeat protein
MPTPNLALRQARERHGWTQVQVAAWIEAAAFTIHRWEAGLSVPSPHYRQRLCQLFRCEAQALELVPLAASDAPLSVPEPETAAERIATRRQRRLPAGFGPRLAQARLRLQLSQEALAEAVGATARSVIRWEQERADPHPYYRERLCVLLQSTPHALFGIGVAAQPVPALTPFWKVPMPSNPYFTGRDAFLHELHARFQAERQAAVMRPQILCGLGGIGKTQAALEYAYRFRNDYQAVLWVGAETPETLLADYRALAQLFELPEQASTNQVVVQDAVKRWFQGHTNWLLIFDNVEDRDLLQAFLPDTSAGHMLITTRSQIVGALGIPLDLPTMTQEESMLFLLRRARLLDQETSLEEVPPALRAQAQMLVDLFDGLPLALDQAGAYLEETRCSLTDYLERYASRRRVLLDSRGSGSTQYPASVLATLALAFAQVEHASPEAAELLRLCAFLHAEAIPEAFLSQAGDALGPILHTLADDPFCVDHAIKELRRYSLIQRDPNTHLLSLHRLVQAALQESLGEAECTMWIGRLIHALLRIFPGYEQAIQEGGGVQARCQPYLSHALACVAALQARGMHSLEAAELLYRVGYYLQLWGSLAQAIPLMEQALAMATTLLGTEHATVAFYWNQLGLLYIEVQDYRRVEACFRHALAIRERVLGPEHPDVAESLWGLAGFLFPRARFAEAQTCAERAITIKERVLGPQHHEVGLVLNILGAIELHQGHYSQAEQLLQRAICLYEQTLGPTHMFLATSKMHLGVLAYRQEDYAHAALRYQEALQILEQRLGPDHLWLASALQALGMVEFAQQHYQEAEIAYHRVLGIYTKASPPESLSQAICLLHFGELALVQGHVSQAKRMVQQAQMLLGEPARLGSLDHQAIIHGLLLAGERLVAQEEQIQAQSCYRQALRIGEQFLDTEHPLTLLCRSKLTTEPKQSSGFLEPAGEVQ